MNNINLIIKLNLIYLLNTNLRHKLNAQFFNERIWMKKRLLSLILISPIFAFGAGGIDKVNTFMQNLSTALYALGAVLLTIAFMWGGSKIMFQGQTLREVAPIFIGGVIFGSASAIAGYIIT